MPSNLRAIESTWRYATIGSEYAVQTFSVPAFSPAMFGVSAVRPPIFRPDRPAAFTAASTPISRSPRSKISQLVLGFRVTTEGTWLVRALVPRLAAGTAFVLTLQLGHHWPIAATNAVSKSSRIGNAVSWKSWTTALPWDWTTTYAATILPHSAS